MSPIVLRSADHKGRTCFLSSAILLSFLIIIWRKNVFFGHITSEQEDTSALSQEKWRSGMRGSYVSMHSRGRRFLAARIPLCPRFPFKAKVLRCCRLNMRSLPVHLDEVGTLILLNILDVFAVRETWLNSTWNDHELNIQGYQLFRQDRETTVTSEAPNGGGVAIYAKPRFTAEE